MVSVIIRHFIYEKCIDILFTRLRSNFTQVDPALLRELIAKSKTLNATFSIEFQQDLVAFHGIDLQQEMFEALEKEIQREIDAEILGSMRDVVVCGDIRSTTRQLSSSYTCKPRVISHNIEFSPYVQ